MFHRQALALRRIHFRDDSSSDAAGGMREAFLAGIKPASTGVIVLTVSGGCQSQKMESVVSL